MEPPGSPLTKSIASLASAAKRAEPSPRVAGVARGAHDGKSLEGNMHATIELASLVDQAEASASANAKALRCLETQQSAQIADFEARIRRLEQQDITDAAARAAASVAQAEDIARLKSTVGRLDRERKELLLRAAATRIEEIVIEDALSITRGELRLAQLYSLHNVRALIKRFKSGDTDGLPAFVDTSFIAKAESLQAAMEGRLDSVLQGDVRLGVNAVKMMGAAAAHQDPADNSDDWDGLLVTVDEIYGGKAEHAAVLAMVRAYIFVRMGATMETNPATAPRQYLAAP